MQVALSLILACTLGQADVEPVKAANLEKANSKFDDVDPYISPNGAMLLFSSDRNGQYDAWISKRSAATSPWSDATTFSTVRGADLRGPFPFKDFLYFASNETQGEENVKLRNFDLYRRIEQVAPIPMIHVSQREDEARPWITAGGTEFYFSRKMKDGWTLFVANGPVPGPVGKPREVGFEPGFSHACLTTSGLGMYLQGPADGGKTGIYKSTRVRPGAAWSKPEPLSKLNHPESKRGDMTPCVSPDGQKLYFASDRPGGRGGMDLWVVPLEKLK